MESLPFEKEIPYFIIVFTLHFLNSRLHLKKDLIRCAAPWEVDISEDKAEKAVVGIWKLYLSPKVVVTWNKYMMHWPDPSDFEMVLKPRLRQAVQFS